METKNNLEYRLDDPEEEVIQNQLLEKKNTTKNKIIIFVIIISIVIVAGIIIIILVLKKKKDDDNTDYYIFKNIPITKNKIIINSFKSYGENYNPILGNINSGKDYEENNRTNFDICIPYNITKRKNKYNRIYLFIHGGAWIGGTKTDVEEKCKKYEYLGFIFATMSHTLLNGTYKEANMFRIIDEIASTIKSIKTFLKNKGFDDNKLEMVIGGGSSGAHLSMLYSYMIKNPAIPIKFVYNNVGPVTLEPKYFLSTKIYNDSLENIEPEDIENAKANGKLISMNSDPNVLMNNIGLISFMNLAIGRKFNDNFDEIFSDLEKGEVNENSEKYIELLIKAKFAFPVTYVDNKSIPTICVYGGQDQLDGVAQYALLKETFVNHANKDNITLVYYKYGTHEVNIPKCEDEKNTAIKEDKVFYEHTQKYLIQDK